MYLDPYCTRLTQDLFAWLTALLSLSITKLVNMFGVSFCRSRNRCNLTPNHQTWGADKHYISPSGYYYLPLKSAPSAITSIRQHLTKMLWVVLGKFSHCLKQAIPVSLECCVTETTVCRNHYQMSCPWDTRVATLWVLMLSVTSSVRLEVYQSITARCQFITFQYFCKIDQGHLYTFFRHTIFL